MSKKVVFAFDKNFEAWNEWLNTCSKTEVSKMRDKAARSIGIRGLEYARAHAGSPVTSRLKDSLNVGDPENFFKVEVTPSTTLVVYGSCIPYAAALENGYDQKNRVNKTTGKKPSLFVPGYWAGNTFKYVPRFKTGMVLTGRVVEGKHMFQKSLDELKTKGDVGEIYLNGLRNLWNLLT